MGDGPGRPPPPDRRRRRPPGQGPAVPESSTCWCPRAAWRCSSTPSTSRAGACGRRPRRPCCRACRWSSSPPPATAWLTQRMVRDVVDAGVLPPGALSVICGSSAGLLDQLQPFDVVSFTGSADTAAVIRSHPRWCSARCASTSRPTASTRPCCCPARRKQRSLRPAGQGSGARDDGQVGPEVHRHPPRVRARSAVRQPPPRPSARAWPRPPWATRATRAVRMGALVSRAQLDSVREGLAHLKPRPTLHDGANARLVDADPAVACCVGPTLLGTRNAGRQRAACTTPKCSAPWPPWCPTATPRTRWHWCAAARARWWPRCTAATRRTGRRRAGAGRQPRPRARHFARRGRAAHRPRQRDAAVAARRPGPRRWRRRTGWPAALNFYHRRSAVQASTAVLGNLRWPDA
jgi:3,4-dehydroadipyl-CoA semialdehyde dehydrogenase